MQGCTQTVRTVVQNKSRVHYSTVNHNDLVATKVVVHELVAIILVVQDDY